MGPADDGGITAEGEPAAAAPLPPAYLSSPAPSPPRRPATPSSDTMVAADAAASSSAIGSGRTCSCIVRRSAATWISRAPAASGCGAAPRSWHRRVRPGTHSTVPVGSPATVAAVRHLCIPRPATDRQQPTTRERKGAQWAPPHGRAVTQGDRSCADAFPTLMGGGGGVIGRLTQLPHPTSGRRRTGC
jgi:hypothetical protein